MTQDVVKALSDDQLVQMTGWIQVEQKARAERRKKETIAKIKEMARSQNIAIRLSPKRSRRARNSGGLNEEKPIRPALSNEAGLARR